MKKSIFMMAAAGLLGLSLWVSNLHAAERIFYDGFEQGLGQWVLLEPALHRQSSEFAHSGAYAHKVRDAGSMGEIASVEFETPPDRKIYLSFWWLLVNAPDTGGKLARFVVPGTGAQLEIWWTNGSHTIAVHHYDITDEFLECGDGTSRVHYTQAAVFDHHWHHFEIFIEYNTPGIDDGRLRVWIDRPGNASYADSRYLKVDDDDVLYINDGACEVYYSNLRLPTDLDARMQPGSLYYDDVELWDGLPSVKTAPLAPPTGLRIIQ